METMATTQDEIDRKSFEAPDAITRTSIRTGRFLTLAQLVCTEYDDENRAKLNGVDPGTYWREVVRNPMGDVRVTLWHRNDDGINYALREYIPARSIDNADDPETPIGASTRNLVRYLYLAALVRAGITRVRGRVP